MKNKWTGGQYSLFRAFLAIFLIIYYLKELVFFPTIAGFFAIMGIIASAFLLIGKNDRYAALSLIALLIGRLIVVEPDPTTVTLLALVVFHAFLPKNPYGSWDARKCLGLEKNWRMPKRYYSLHWIVIGLLYIGWAFWQVNPTGRIVAFLGVIAFLIFSLSKAVRPVIWLLMWLIQIALFIKGTPNGVLLLAHWFIFNPGWIRPQKRGYEYILFYDAPCGLCSSFIKFLLCERPSENRLKFASLKGITGKQLLQKSKEDTVVLYHKADELLRWKAIAAVLAQLGGIWRLISPVLSILPDKLYDFIASRRHKIKKQASLFIPAKEKESFLP